MKDVAVIEYRRSHKSCLYCKRSRPTLVEGFIDSYNGFCCTLKCKEHKNKWARLCAMLCDYYVVEEE